MVKVIRGQKLVQYFVLSTLWIGSVLFFWRWWISPTHVGNPILYGLVSIALFYISTLLVSFYLFFLGQMATPKQIHPDYALRGGVVGRIAVIKLMVPGSESIELLERQLKAMVNVKQKTESYGFAVDLWILVDKVHSPEVKEIADRYGVMYFCRHDVGSWGLEQVRKWNSLSPPFKEKTKAGNFNSWLYTFGSYYTHFVQLDFDHVPKPSYLLHVLGYFTDPNVKWVQSPSLYGNHDSWCARGASEQELVLQGPLQMGFFGFSGTPMIIGSHCTYDVAAILEIGGFQPTRAEDHLDTVFLAAKGYRGVFVPKPLAIGDGPETFETYCAQQFAWAFSMFQVLFQFTPKMVRTMRPKAALQFLFAETWYLFISLSYLILTISVPISLVTNTEIAKVVYVDFLIHSMPMSIVGFAIWFWSKKWQQPKGLGLTWRGIVLHVARWPVVLSALVQVIFQVQKPYMITPKGVHTAITKPFFIRSFVPYFGLTFAMLASCWYFVINVGRSNSEGYMLYAIWGATIFIAIYAVVLAMNLFEMRREGVSVIRAYFLRLKAILVLLVLVVALGFTTNIAAPKIWEAIMYTSSQQEMENVQVQTLVGAVSFLWPGNSHQSAVGP